MTSTESPLRSCLEAIASFPTGTTSAGYPFLSKDSWRILRNEVPVLFGMGTQVLEEAVQLVESSADLPEQERQRRVESMQVVRQVVYTAAITAPPDLWLMRNILATFAELGLHRRLLEGEGLFPETCTIEGKPLNADVLRTDLSFLHARGLVEAYDDGYRIAGHPRARDVLAAADLLPEGLPASATRWWRALFLGEELSADQHGLLQRLGTDLPRRTDWNQNHWIPTPQEVELGFRLLPVVLGLRATGQTLTLKEGVTLEVGCWGGASPATEQSALEILAAAGWLASAGDPGAEAEKRSMRFSVTKLGARGFSRGPGPFGIIETYQAYLDRGVDLLLHGAGEVWVERGENVGASQDANRRAFELANDALDRFCGDTGFEYQVFVEHAVGRGEAIRIRYERSGGEGVRYFGADLEDAAIDEAQREKERGVLPENLAFVRRADIGAPQILADALQEAGVAGQPSVMMVGNGFHEVRDQDLDSMTKVLRGYERMGMVLLFTEENALSVEDLRNTAWNTYHAGFKYVHELSGQILRPGVTRSAYRSGHLMRASWEECAVAAGYVRADQYCSRTRTIYPYPTRDGHNPAVSRNHFFVPRELADRMGLE